MKQPSGNALVTVSAVALLVVIAIRVTPVFGVGEEWQPVLPWKLNSQNQPDQFRIPSQYDLVLLALGRSVYANLQRARQAALNRESTNLMVAIEEARQTIGRLLSPAEAGPLRKQLEIIRNDLRDRSKQLDSGLWVPVEAEIDDTLVDVPEEVKAQAHEAIHKAREAALQNDRKQVSKQLDVVTSTMEYSLGVFPVGRVKEDLDSALASANLSPPNWTGALEAVQSALASFHWYTREPAHALLSAYNDVVNAYVLVAGPEIQDDQQLEIAGYLTRAHRDLDSLPDGKALADEVRHLIDKAEPQGSDLKLLLRHIQGRMQLEQAQSLAQYWKSIGPATPE